MDDDDEEEKEDPFPRDQIDKFFRPHVNRIYNSPSLTILPPIPIPEIDLKIIHDPNGCKISDIDRLHPEYTKCMQEIRKFHDPSDKLSVNQQKRIKELATLSGFYEIPGFTKPKTYIEHMFRNPTKTMTEFKNRRVFDVASEAIPEPVPEFKIKSQEEYLKAVYLARKKDIIAKLRAEGKSDEADALESDKYDIYMPEGPEKEPEEKPVPTIKKRNIISKLPDYAHEVGRSLLNER
ncbi:hypothetical protein O3M35_012241 [Rhynocoris fuscipes]|uniref:Uncharacterized protein n=1 Tax=Rhynocoris fuscipes TaxID=488301 RepID=A0AAW1CZ35_9HEMI